MSVAAIYDIHGNLPALEAVLEEVRSADVEQIVVGGDVLPGPMPRETLACLRTLGIPVQFIFGNGDRAVLARLRGQESSDVPASIRDVIRWNAEQLGRDDEQFLAGWPATLRLEIAGLGRVLFCHATPGSDSDIFTRLTPVERLAPFFTGLDVAMVVCGHTHMQFERTVGNVRILNAGSVGMPFGEPGAYWLRLGAEVEFRRTPYDLAAAAERVRATLYPQAADFATRGIWQPPSEEEAINSFAAAELKSG